ncbi:MAG: PaaI family thioesterase [Deltaproteobacteria bacterium]|nr:PaaI family thioesterase [Deltaproteobacteria bacterium]
MKIHAMEINTNEELRKVSPFAGSLGIEPLEAGNGFARIRLPFRDDLTNPAGRLHGGVIATLADSAMAMAVGSVLGVAGRHFTVKLEMKYKESVTNGEIVAEATVRRRKPRVFLGEAIVKNGNGQVVATATATFMVRDSDPKTG